MLGAAPETRDQSDTCSEKSSLFSLPYNKERLRYIHPRPKNLVPKRSEKKFYPHVLLVCKCPAAGGIFRSPTCLPDILSLRRACVSGKPALTFLSPSSVHSHHAPGQSLAQPCGLGSKLWTPLSSLLTRLQGTGTGSEPRASSCITS